MPIRPELRHLYQGPEYESQRLRILKREQNRCKWCSKPNGGLIQTKTGMGRMFWRRMEPRGPWLNESGWVMIPEDHEAAMLLGKPRIIRVVLAMAHLDHNPLNRDDANVALLCQWHHLIHDRSEHREHLVLNRDAKRPLCEVVIQVA